MTEQAPPEGSKPRPIPDLGFFAGPPTRGSSAFGGPRPAPPIGPPANGQFGGAPGNQFGAAPFLETVPPPVYGPPTYGPPPIYGPPPGRPSGGLPVWVIVLICVSLAPIVIGVLAAIAIPVFLNQRAKAVDESTTIIFPASMENLPRQTGPQAESLIQSFLSELAGNSRDSQAGIYSDQSKHQIFVVSSRPPKGSGRLPIDKTIDSFWRGARDGLPAGVTLSVAADRDAGRLGGRMSCATFTGITNGQICAAADSVALVGVFDLSPSPDPDLPRRVREAVVHRR